MDLLIWRPFFSYTPYVFTFLIPALSMRAISEERKTGTWELLRTSPLSLIQIILAKYLALVTLVFLAVLPTLLYAYSIFQLGDPVGNLDLAGFFWELDRTPDDWSHLCCGWIICEFADFTAGRRLCVGRFPLLCFVLWIHCTG
ncbi:ABC transporter permease [Algoriphagus boritolerans]|uniref:ABC transporter permease n=1 Tax=Algoriphagus boritolerans TaxID=308111 RepID=UPI002FCDE464